jgi:hypothetical protein
MQEILRAELSRKRKEYIKMRLSVKSFAAPAVLLALLALPAAGRATSCTMQAEIAAARSGCADGCRGTADYVAVAGQDEAALKAALLPAVARIGSQSARRRRPPPC